MTSWYFTSSGILPSLHQFDRVTYTYKVVVMRRTMYMATIRKSNTHTNNFILNECHLHTLDNEDTRTTPIVLLNVLL